MPEVIENNEGTKMMKDVPSNSKANAALTLGVIGTALSGMGILGAGTFGLANKGNRGNNNAGPNMPPPIPIITPEGLYLERKVNDNYIENLKRFYDGQIADQNRDAAMQFDTYKREMELYKYTRDTNDTLTAKINEVDKKVDIMAAIRPYQDAIINGTIANTALMAQYSLDKRTSHMIDGQVVLPSTPTVTGYSSYAPTTATTGD